MRTARARKPGVEAGAAGERSYHHGDLRQALIEAGELLLAERGVEGFSLRECARRAGVSASAPAHHFGNATGLLTAIATLGFEGLAAAMQRAVRQAGASPQARLQAIGGAYIAYALAHPARFRVVFGSLPLDHGDAALAAAAKRAYEMLAAAIAALPGRASVPQDSAKADLVLAWSTVHGFACLALDGQLPLGDAKDRTAALRKLTRQVVERLPRGNR
ncbi:transcriptional regulator, TetR family [Rhizobiales bacterium GAS113]|nr:transcriptional regulator, TetR family [Rhizobiales bacterium GAS113]